MERISEKLKAKILIKEKPCKGHGKAKEWAGCGKMTDVRKRRYGLCPLCLFEWMDNTEAGNIYREKVFLPRVSKRMKKQRNKKRKEQRESLKSISRLINEARVPFQRWIKFRDANDPCISCGDTSPSIWHAGHYLKAEVYTGLIFDEMNVNKQCAKCNTYLNGNEAEYRKGLVKKYGEQKVKHLEDSADKLRMHRYSKEELRAIKQEYQKRLNDAR